MNPPQVEPPSELRGLYWRALVLQEGPRCAAWLLRRGLTRMQRRLLRRRGVVFYIPASEEDVVGRLWFRAAMDLLALRPKKWRVTRTEEGAMARWFLERVGGPAQVPVAIRAHERCGNDC